MKKNSIKNYRGVSLNVALKIPTPGTTFASITQVPQSADHLPACEAVTYLISVVRNEDTAQVFATAQYCCGRGETQSYAKESQEGAVIQLRVQFLGGLKTSGNRSVASQLE